MNEYELYKLASAHGKAVTISGAPMRDHIIVCVDGVNVEFKSWEVYVQSDPAELEKILLERLTKARFHHLVGDRSLR